jgi:hypothetical protein
MNNGPCQIYNTLTFNLPVVSGPAFPFGCGNGYYTPWLDGRQVTLQRVVGGYCVWTTTIPDPNDPSQSIAITIHGSAGIITLNLGYGIVYTSGQWGLLCCGGVFSVSFLSPGMCQAFVFPQTITVVGSNCAACTGAGM